MEQQYIWNMEQRYFLIHGTAIHFGTWYTNIFGTMIYLVHGAVIYLIHEQQHIWNMVVQQYIWNMEQRYFLIYEQ